MSGGDVVIAFKALPLVVVALAVFVVPVVMSWSIRFTLVARVVFVAAIAVCFSSLLWVAMVLGSIL